MTKWSRRFLHASYRVTVDNYWNINAIVKEVRKTSAQEGTLFIAGNGGSMTNAIHLASDLLSIPMKLHIDCMNNIARLTAISNDVSYENIFCESIERHGKPGDILFSMSVSGESANLIRAAKLAKDKDMRVISLLGTSQNSTLGLLSDIYISIPSTDYGIVEALHNALCHNIASELRGE